MKRIKNKKGGYTVKNGYYVKNECKNNEADGSIDQEGFILDPLTYEKIPEGNIVQLSDGLCYNKSKDLAKSIRKRNTLPFGHPLTIMDEANFTSSSIPSISSIESSISPEDIQQLVIPPPPIVPGFVPEWHPATRSYILRREPTIPPEEISISPEPIQQPVIPPQPIVSGFIPEWHPATRSYILRREPPIAEEPRRRVINSTATRRRPRVLIIESDSPEQIQHEPRRRRGRPPGSRNRNTRSNIARGTKKHRKNRKKY